jgi:hypothetical protein
MNGKRLRSINPRPLRHRITFQCRNRVSLNEHLNPCSRSKSSMFAATVAATAFIVIAGCEMFWALGGSWELSRAWGGNHDHLPVGLRVASAFAAILLVAGAIIVLGCARYSASPDRLGILRWGTWTLVGAMALSALANFASSSSLERFQNGPVALLLALLCLVVASAN